MANKLRLVICTLALVIAACASSRNATPQLRLTIGGQVIDRQFRELVIMLTNGGSSNVRNVRLEIEAPDALAVIRESHAPELALRDSSAKNGTRTWRYDVAELRANTSVAVYLPFRHQTLGALNGATVRAVADAPGMREPLVTTRIFGR